jgi:spermidine synthase
MGSGAGCLIPLLTFFHIRLYDILFIISMVTLCAALGGSTHRVRHAMVCIVGVALVILHVFVFRFSPLPMSSFKDLAQAENLTAAKKEMEVSSPLGLVTVLDSAAYHYFPDLSLNCPHPLPRQKGLFIDGNTIGAINEFTGNFRDVRFMDYRTNSLAYELLYHPNVLIIGGGSGTEVLNAHYHAANTVTVAEMNGDIVRMMQGPYGTFSGNIYAFQKTNVVIEEGRGYLQGTRDRFALIQFSLMESMGAASAGVYSLNENYLFTTEAIRLCLDRLRPGGILSISTWIKNPPRDNIKLLAMAIEAVERQEKHPPAQSIVMIRSWQTATLLVKNGIFQNKDIRAIQDFCKSRLFDISYYPGIAEGETNIFNRLDEDIFYTAAMKLLSPEREKFYETYPFYIQPATDDRPFFSHFFKIDAAKDFFISSNRAVIPFLDWGYILVWITAGILFLLGIIFILAPLPIVLPHHNGLISVILYFGSLGMAYIFFEISFLQQFIRYLTDPIFSASVVIGSFLVYSGIGSLIAGKVIPVKAKLIFISVLVIGIAGFVFLTEDRWLQNILSGFPLPLRMLSCSLLIAPLAIPMGVFFPSGLNTLTGKQEGLIPWAWSINGFFSVIGSSASVLIAITWGFRSIIVLAVLLYILSAFIFTRLSRNVFSPRWSDWRG